MQEITITIERPFFPPIRWEDSWEGTYKGYRFFILGGHPEAGYIDILIHGKRARIRWQLAVERYLERVKLPRRTRANELELRAPMPGLVREVRVQPGEAVTPTTPVLVIEAMKMENLLFAPGEGVVEAIFVSPGTPVEKGALLLRFIPPSHAD